MKHIKLLFSISLLALSSIANAQQKFIDSSSYYTYVNAPSLSQGLNFAHYSKETVILDSTNVYGDYFTVDYYVSNLNVIPKFYSQYNLKCIGDKVYFTGKLRSDNKDSFEVSDLEIYDFSLNEGDTLKIKHSLSGLNIQLLVDSIKNIQYEDGIYRETHFYNVIEGIPNEYYSHPIAFAAKGLGSNFGLLPFKLIRRNAPFWQQLISVCGKNKKVVYSANDQFDHWNISDYCDEQAIVDLIDTIRSLSIDRLSYQLIKIFPNPVNNELSIQGVSSGTYSISSSVGKKVLEGKFENYINISGLSNGIYYILIKQEDKIYVNRFVKE